MSIDFVTFGFKFLVTKSKAVMFSISIGVGGYLWSVSSNIHLAGIACFEFKNNAPISASTANDITLLMILAIFKTAPLFLGSWLFSEMNKWPLALLLAFGSVRYDASLCTFNTILLVLKVKTVSGCVAT